MKTITPLQTGWRFYRGAYPVPPGAETQTVDLPHTWNAVDGQDGGGDYFRGECCYYKKINISKKEGTLYYLEFYGVNSVCNLYVNGVHIGEHRGGYTLFRFNITGALKSGENEIIVPVSNFPFPDVIPLTADFTFFGGIYREVNFIEVSGAHFSLEKFGSDGVLVTYPNTPQIAESAQVTVRAAIKGAESGCRLRVSISQADTFVPCVGIDQPDFELEQLTDPAQQTVAEAETEITSAQMALTLCVASPHLWNGRKAPFRYKVRCEILQNGSVCDCVEKYIGFRYFRIDPKKGFFLF